MAKQSISAVSLKKNLQTNTRYRVKLVMHSTCFKYSSSAQWCRYFCLMQSRWHPFCKRLFAEVRTNGRRPCLIVVPYLMTGPVLSNDGRERIYRVGDRGYSLHPFNMRAAVFLACLTLACAGKYKSKFLKFSIYSNL